MSDTQCESCAHYVYDEYDDCWYCDQELDSDELERFLRGAPTQCAYFRLDDEYGIVRKQN